MASKNTDSFDKIALLYDFYGMLLTDKQREMMTLYYENDFSLGEIADEYGISRQGVHDSIKKSRQLIEEYEEKLGLVEKMLNARESIAVIDAKVDSIIAALEKKDADSADNAIKELRGIKAIIDNLEN